jgi:hypothetical protein
MICVMAGKECDNLFDLAFCTTPCELRTSARADIFIWVKDVEGGAAD